MNMDAVIKAAVKDELERQAAQQSPRTQQQAQVQAVQPCTSSGSTTSTGERTSNGQNLSTRTVSRLSGLLDRVKKGAKTSSKGKKRKIDKEHRIQVRDWDARSYILLSSNF
jgi:hypothetical protein